MGLELRWLHILDNVDHGCNSNNKLWQINVIALVASLTQQVQYIYSSSDVPGWRYCRALTGYRSKATMLRDAMRVLFSRQVFPCVCSFASVHPMLYCRQDPTSVCFRRIP